MVHECFISDHEPLETPSWKQLVFPLCSCFDDAVCSSFPFFPKGSQQQVRGPEWQVPRLSPPANPQCWMATHNCLLKSWTHALSSLQEVFQPVSGFTFSGKSSWTWGFIKRQSARENVQTFVSPREISGGGRICLVDEMHQRTCRIKDLSLAFFPLCPEEMPLRPQFQSLGG